MPGVYLLGEGMMRFEDMVHLKAYLEADPRIKRVDININDRTMTIIFEERKK